MCAARWSPWKRPQRFYLRLINRLEQTWSMFAANKLQRCRVTPGNDKARPPFSRNRKRDRFDASDEDDLNEQQRKYLNSALIPRLRGGTFFQIVPLIGQSDTTTDRRPERHPCAPNGNSRRGRLGVLAFMICQTLLGFTKCRSGAVQGARQGPGASTWPPNVPDHN